MIARATYSREPSQSSLTHITCAWDPVVRRHFILILRSRLVSPQLDRVSITAFFLDSINSMYGGLWTFEPRFWHRGFKSWFLPSRASHKNPLEGRECEWAWETRVAVPGVTMDLLDDPALKSYLHRHIISWLLHITWYVEHVHAR